MTVAYVGLGANLGDPHGQLEQALRDLEALPRTRLVRRSSWYRSAPLGYEDQPAFLNAVAELDTELAPAQLLSELHAIEARHGRRRSFPNAPRTLDLDLLLHGEAAVDSSELRLPHPRMHERAFVLLPLLEIAPQARIPGRGPAKALLGLCGDQRVEKLA